MCLALVLKLITSIELLRANLVELRRTRFTVDVCAALLVI